MKVTKKPTEAGFKPVTIEITFETKDELEAALELFARETTVPAYLENEQGVQKKYASLLSTTMHKIYLSLVAL